MTDKNSEENLDCVHKFTEFSLQENPGKMTADMTEEALEGVKAAWLQEQNLIKVFSHMSINENIYDCSIPILPIGINPSFYPPKGERVIY